MWREDGEIQRKKERWAKTAGHELKEKEREKYGEGKDKKER